MNKFCFITTSYCENCEAPTAEQLKSKFNIDSTEDNLYVNFSNNFSPFNHSNIPNVGLTRRKDLVYGKIFKLYDFLKNRIKNNFEYVCHFDFSDTIFCKSAVEMMDKFISNNKQFLICAEKPCWPYFDAVSKWGTPIANFVNDDSRIANYLNSGVIISKTDILIDLLSKLKEVCLSKNIDFWDDQGAWQYYYNFIDNSLSVDYESEYTICTAFLKEDSYYFKDKTLTINNHNKATPYIIHDNSSFSANLVDKFRKLI